MVNDWNSFAAEVRTRCVEMPTMGSPSRSYVELLTCLELARDVRKLPREENTTSGGSSTIERGAGP